MFHFIQKAMTKCFASRRELYLNFGNYVIHQYDTHFWAEKKVTQKLPGKNLVVG